MIRNTVRIFIEDESFYGEIQECKGVYANSTSNQGAKVKGIWGGAKLLA